MTTDNWPDEEGYIVEGTVIGFAESGSAITEGRAVAFGTAASGKVVVTAASAIGDSFGVALKAATASGQKIPVAVGGLMKMTSSATITVGFYVMNSTDGHVTRCLCPWTNAGAVLQIFTGGVGSHILGLCLQDGSTAGNEVLVLLGKTC